MSIVPTHLLQKALLPLIEKINNELDEKDNTGARMLLCYRASKSLSMTPQAIFRRMYDVLKGNGRSTKVEWADGVLLAAGVDIKDTDVFCVPAGMKAALERIEIRCELQGIVLTKKQKKEMAEDLLEWSRLVIHDGYEAIYGKPEATVVDFPEPVEDEAAAA